MKLGRPSIRLRRHPAREQAVKPDEALGGENAGAIFALLAIVFAGCTSTSDSSGALAWPWNIAVGSKFHQPGFEAPQVFRSQLGPAEAASLADQPWWQVFYRREAGPPGWPGSCQQLRSANRGCARTGIAGLVGVAASQFFPQAGYQGQAAREKVFFPGFPSNVTINSFTGVLNVAWEIDRVGPDSPIHRSGASELPRQRRRAPRRDALAGQRRGRRLLPADGTGSRTPDRARQF